MEFINKLKAKAKEDIKRIVLPEGLEERTLKAADTIISEGFAKIILIGNPDAITAEAKKFNLTNIDKATIIDAQNQIETVIIAGYACKYPILIKYLNSCFFLK